MRWVRAQPSLALVIAINIGWTLLAVLPPRARPFGRHLWGGGEGSPVERFEVGLLVACVAAWAWIAWRMHRRAVAGSDRGKQRPVLAALMVVQLVVVLGEELDWSALGLPFRNLRGVLRAFSPDIMDSPAIAAYLLCFLFAPLLPARRVRAWLERAAPVRAELGDALATLLAPLCPLLVWPIVAEQEHGELQQLGVYAVLGVVTARVARRSGAA